MPFKKKSVVKVGTKEWEVLVPRPPNHATHARMMAFDPFSSDPTPKQVTLPIQDFGCFKGVSGDFYYLRMNNKRKILQEWDKDSWYWDGYRVVGIEELANT
jgi:hypothetical protein